MKNIVLNGINFYKKILSPVFEYFFGHACRFTPTCSQYSKEAIMKFGIFKGGIISIRRILRCHPFSKGGYDPVILS